MSLENETKSTLKTHRLIIAEWATLLSVFLGCFIFLFYKIEKQAERTDHIFEIQSNRSDRLYEMFIDLIKEGRK
jgi:hypothetical protein